MPEGSRVEVDQAIAVVLRNVREVEQSLAVADTMPADDTRRLELADLVSEFYWAWERRLRIAVPTDVARDYYAARILHVDSARQGGRSRASR